PWRVALLALLATFLVALWTGGYRSLWVWIPSVLAAVAGGFWVLRGLRRGEERKRRQRRVVNPAKTWFLPIRCPNLCIWVGLIIGSLLGSYREELTNSWFEFLLSPWLWLLIGILILPLAVWAACYRRQKCVARFRDQLTKWIAEHRQRVGPDEQPVVHVIAHSFGTYLTGETLRQNGEVEEELLTVHRVILVGSVLPSSYPWHEVIGEEPDWCFEQVRNEV